MPADRIKVLPNVPSAIGMKHPYDCPLDENGSEWPLDSFTCRRLADESIRRAEVEPEAPTPPGKVSKTKAAVPTDTLVTDGAPASETPAA